MATQQQVCALTPAEDVSIVKTSTEPRPQLRLRKLVSHPIIFPNLEPQVHLSHTRYLTNSRPQHHIARGTTLSIEKAHIPSHDQPLSSLQQQ